MEGLGYDTCQLSAARRMILPFLKKVSIFSSLDEGDMEEIAGILKPVSVSQNMCLFREGDRGECLYVVYDGEAEVVKRMGSSEELVLRVLRPGDYFGEMCFFSRKETRSASVRARSRLHLLELGRAELDALIARRPGVSEIMVRELSLRFNESEKNLMLGIRKKNLQLKKQSIALLEAENLANMGRAIATLIHDIKTPLVAIGGFTRIVHRHLEEGSSDRDKLELVLKETQRLERMVKNMLDFARPLELEHSHADIADVLRESLAIVEPIAAERHVKIERGVWGDPAMVSIDINRIKQVLINLVLNAVQASPEGGTVTVHCRRYGGALLIDVADCGCGIPPEKKARIFSPFFTTKQDGTGLGLCIVKRIVEAHKGSIRILDNVDSGTIFRVEIPQDEQEERQATP